MTKSDKNWFPAKRYGWGWGPPRTWQGWAVLVAWTLLTMAGIIALHAKGWGCLHPYTLLYVLFMVIVFSVICWWKGDKLRWRWGEDQVDE